MLAIKIYLIFSILAILWFDVRRYIIPNWLVASLLALYPVGVLLAPQAVDWKMALAGMAAVFVVGYAVFAFKWMGAGDVKLITVCSLWAGLPHLLDFIFMVAVLGGLFSAGLWGVRKTLPTLPHKFTELPRILREGEPVPYGVAIALGFLWIIVTRQIPVLFGQ